MGLNATLEKICTDGSLRYKQLSSNFLPIDFGKTTVKPIRNKKKNPHGS